MRGLLPESQHNYIFAALLFGSLLYLHHKSSSHGYHTTHTMHESHGMPTDLHGSAAPGEELAGAAAEHSMHAHAGMHGDMAMVMMPMSFQASYDTILWFDAWHPKTPLTYVASILALLAFAIAHEALAAYRVTHAAMAGASAATGGFSTGGYEADPVVVGGSGGASRASRRAAMQQRVVTSCLYAGGRGWRTCMCMGPRTLGCAAALRCSPGMQPPHC